jgi:hypothetical protein
MVPVWCVNPSARTGMRVCNSAWSLYEVVVYRGGNGGVCIVPVWWVSLVPTLHGASTGVGVHLGTRMHRVGVSHGVVG